MSLNKAPKGTLGLALKFLMIILGSAVYAVGFQFFMYPNSITSGGIIGIAMIINELTKLPVGTMTIILRQQENLVLHTLPKILHLICLIRMALLSLMAPSM